LVVGPLGCNCSIIADASGDAIVVDPGGDFEGIWAVIKENQLNVRSIVHTHTHIDHVGGTAALQRETGAEALIHEADRFLYEMLDVQAAMLGLPRVDKCDLSGGLTDDRAISAGNLELGVLHTPGHTPGSVCFKCADEASPIVFTGDTLFARGIGRTDLWGGDADAIFRSLKGRLMALDDETLVVPGHGPATTIGRERSDNPFLRSL
jgi:glyoxylase-like metal-dependent hydrolase (beta-lactamase superfamily II)